MEDPSTSATLYVEEGRRYVLSEEERGRTFQTSATTLVAAIGVVLSISLAMGERLHDRDLFVGDTASNATYIAGAVFLLAAGVLALRAIFPPAVERSDIELLGVYQEPPFSNRSVDDTRAALVEQTRDELARLKSRNDKARRRLKQAAPCFGVGALLIAFVGTTIAVTPKREKTMTSKSHAVSKKDTTGRRTVIDRQVTSRSSP